MKPIVEVKNLKKIMQKKKQLNQSHLKLMKMKYLGY